MPFKSTNLLEGFPVNSLSNDFPVGKLLVAGDLYAGGRAESLMEDPKVGSLWADFDEEIGTHQISIVNLECPLTNSTQAILKSGPHLSASPDCAASINLGGFNIVSLANNHIKDMGEAGVLDTIVSCEEVGLKTVGAGRDLKDATQPLIVEINEMRVGILAIAEGEFSLATVDSAGAWPLDIIDNFHQIQEAKEQVDFVLVIFHGGVEFYSLPTPDMVKICRFFVDAGADAVVCHHIHVPSGLEIYRSSPIIYSTGNFLFDWPQSITPFWHTGYMVSLDIQKHSVAKVRLIPYKQCKNECTVTRMSVSESDEFLAEISELSSKIIDEETLQLEFRELVQTKRQRYISTVLSMSEIENKLFNRGVWPSWRTRAIRFARLKNSFVCKSHHNLIISVLNSELESERFRRLYNDKS